MNIKTFNKKFTKGSLVMGGWLSGYNYQSSGPSHTTPISSFKAVENGLLYMVRKITVIIYLLLLSATSYAVQKEDIEKIENDQKYPDHPFLLMNKDEIDDLIRQIAKPGWKSVLYNDPRDEFAMLPVGKGIRTNARFWLDREIVIPERSGHYHNFFCDDGTRLSIPDNQTFQPGPYHCPACSRTYSGEKYEAALRRFIHADLSIASFDLALVSVLENKLEYAAKAAEILLHYADAYPGPHTGLTTGGMIYQSLDESMWIIPLAQCYDLVYPTLMPKQREKIENFLTIAAKGIQACGANGNWGSWHLSAVGIVGYAVNDQELVKWAIENFKRQIHNELGDDGLWPESVHTYHFFPFQAFLYFAEASFHAGNPLYNWEAKPGKSLMSMFRAPLNYMYPDLRLPAINDGWFDSFLPADLYELACRREGNELYQWVLSNGYKKQTFISGKEGIKSNSTQRTGLYAFLFGNDLEETGKTTPANESVNFPILGIYMLKSPESTMMTFDYGKFMGHGQFDKMGITLFAHHKLWMADYGTPGYGSTILPWYKSTYSHNTVVVDGKQQSPTNENTVEYVSSEAHGESVSSKTSQAYKGVDYQRTVIRKNGYFVIVDDLKGDSSRVYDFYLHSEGILDLLARKTNHRIEKIPSQWISNVVSFVPQTFIQGKWSDNNQGVAIWMGGSSPLTAISAKCPAETEIRKIDLLIVRQQALKARFITVLYPFSGKHTLDVKSRNGMLTIKRGEQTDEIKIPEAL